MYKIIYISTGHVFELPDETAQSLKDNYPDDYRIIEKNGKAIKDKNTKKRKKNSNTVENYNPDSILWKIKEE